MIQLKKKKKTNIIALLFYGKILIKFKFLHLGGLDDAAPLIWPSFSINSLNRGTFKQEKKTKIGKKRNLSGRHCSCKIIYAFGDGLRH
jgi:hypothetical protein